MATGIGLVVQPAAWRHGLLQSNAYDLGLFDQAWPRHRAPAPLDGAGTCWPTTGYGCSTWRRGYCCCRALAAGRQALAPSFTAVPIWSPRSRPAGQAALLVGLRPWWLQPVVFNAALFDFHPETWVMPAFALALWAERSDRTRLWFGLLLLMLGSRDGLVLITAGMAIDLAWRRRWRWSLSAAGLSLGWLLMLSRWLYPLLRNGEGPKAASRMFSHLNGDPLSVLSGLDWGGGGEYLLLLCLPCIALWRRGALSSLLIGLPLVLVNLLSSSASYRTLVHHYSLPLAVVAVVACIDGLQQQVPPRRRFPWSLCWATACWLALAKPWFFTGPYLARLPQLPEVQSALAAIKPTDGVLTTSYLVPQLSQRSSIGFPKSGTTITVEASPWTVLLLNPQDPGWGSSRKRQQTLLTEARNSSWTCQTWPSGLELCRAPDA